MRILIYISIALLLWSCHQTTSTSNTQQLAPGIEVSELSWLTGTWQVNNKRTYEEWIKLDEWLLGRSYKIENGDTLLLETMQITYRDGILYYIPTVTDQNDGQPVLFPLLSGNPHQVVFENEEHDFPQRIGYRKKGDKHIEAWIEGRDDSGKVKQVVFDMRQ